MAEREPGRVPLAAPAPSHVAMLEQAVLVEAFRGGTDYRHARLLLADMEYDILVAEALREPRVWERFLGYVDRLLRRRYPELAELVDRKELERDPLEALAALFEENASKIGINVRALDRSQIRREAAERALEIVLAACRAVFRDLGWLR